MGLIGRLLYAVSVPHELAHLAVIAPWADDTRLVETPSIGGSGVNQPLAMAAADLPPNTPTAAVRGAAIAPLVVFLGLAGGIELLVRPTGGSLVALIVGFLLAFWATLSAGDLAVFLRAEEAVSNGQLTVTGPVPGTQRASTVLTLGVVVLVAMLFAR